MGWKTNLIIINDGALDEGKLLTALGYGGAIPQAECTCEAMFPPKSLVIGQYAGCTLIAEPKLPTKILDHPDGEEAKRLLNQFSANTVLICTLHSVVNLAGFCLYDKGVLKRCFAVSSDDGVFANIGSPLPEEDRLLSRFVKSTDSGRRDLYQATDGESFTVDQLGEDIVFEVIARLLGDRPDKGDTLFNAHARAYKRRSFFSSLLGH